jgi:putative membrane protein
MSDSDPNPGLRETSTAEDVVLRDRLAADRTILANERTFLAYVRTALALLVSGLALLKFFDSRVAKTVGVLFVICSAVAPVIGIARYRRVSRDVRELKPPSPPPA